MSSSSFFDFQLLENIPSGDTMLSRLSFMLFRMKYKDIMKRVRRYPNKKLHGVYFAYDLDGSVLGEIVYKNGIVISRKVYLEEGENNGQIANKFD